VPGAVGDLAAAHDMTAIVDRGGITALTPEGAEVDEPVAGRLENSGV
jgi:hypothetical protein